MDPSASDILFVAPLRAAFLTNTPRAITKACTDLVRTAQSEEQLQLLESVMHRYQPNAFAVQKSNCLRLAELALHPSPQLPPRLGEAIAKKRKTMVEAPHIEERLRVASELSVLSGSNAQSSVVAAGADAQAPHQLADLFGVSVERVQNIRKAELEVRPVYSLIDISALVTGKSAKMCSEQLHYLAMNFAEKFGHFKFKGRGQKETPVGDVYTCMEVIVLLPGPRAARIRSQAARLLVRVVGGDLLLADQIVLNRERQDGMRLDQVQGLARACGEAAESEAGETDVQIARLERRRKDLYVLSNPFIAGEFKIGRAEEVSSREKSLVSGLNFKLRLHRVFEGGGHLEHAMHKFFANRRVQDVPGKEWFAVPLEEIDAAFQELSAPGSSVAEDAP